MIKPPETKEERQLRDPGIRRVILESIGREVLIGAFTRIEWLCFAHEPAEQYFVDGQPITTLIHREIQCKPTVKDKDLMVKAIVDDILEQRISNFVRLPLQFPDLMSRLEGNGVVIRCSVNLYPELRIVIDYCGWH